MLYAFSSYETFRLLSKLSENLYVHSDQHLLSAGEMYIFSFYKASYLILMLGSCPTNACLYIPPVNPACRLFFDDQLQHPINI